MPLEKSEARKKLALLKTLTPAQLKSAKLTQSDMDYLETLLDPLKWVKKNLKNPEDPNKGFIPYVTQEYIISEEASKVAVRTSRRTGKTVGIAAKAIYLAYTEPNTPILFIAPYQAQIQEIFRDMQSLISDTHLRDSIKRSVEHPFYQIHLKNGSTIFGMTAGAKSGRRGTVVRGQGAKYLFLDEFDFLPEDAVAAILIIMKSRKDSHLFVTSNPSGARSYFYQWCNFPDKHGFTTTHFGKEYIPNWTEEDDKFFMENYSTNAWYREVLGEFGEEMVGVFPHRFIDMSLFEYDYNILAHNQQNAYIIGVDWNASQIGVKIILLEYIRNTVPTQSDKLFLKSVNGMRDELNRQEKTKNYDKLDWDYFISKYRIFRIYSIEGEEFTQNAAVDKILRLYKEYNPAFIYVDQGYGDVQIELLQKQASEWNDKFLAKKVVGCNFSTTIDVKDQWTNKPVKKRLKNFMVNLSVRTLEQYQLALPYSEDNKGLLVGQMREYRVTKEGPTPAYSSENDHYLDALMLAILGFESNFGELSSVARKREPINIRKSFIPIMVQPKGKENRIMATATHDGRLKPFADEMGLPYEYKEGTIPDFTSKPRSKAKAKQFRKPFKRRFTGVQGRKWPHSRLSWE